MKKSFPIERKDQILDLITRKGRITVDELIEKFKVSGATIRRDLEFLEHQGLITRAHGGATSKSRVSLEADFFEEKEKFLEEKRRIGEEAAKLIEEGEVIFLEASTTVLQLARNLKNRRNLTVVTNSLDIACELEKSKGINLILTGGNLKRKTHALIGPLAETTLSQMRLDKAFIGISALDISYGITTATMEEAKTRKDIIRASNKLIVLCDHSKFGKQNFAYVGPLELIDVLITDKGIPDEMRKEIERKGVEVRTV
jgi:DeoR family fructose operon transcriptional repressor